MLQRDLSCMFGSAPIINCGEQVPRVPEAVLASSWPLAVGFLIICGLAAYAYLRTIYQHEIPWESGDERAPSPEDEARRHSNF